MSNVIFVNFDPDHRGIATHSHAGRAVAYIGPVGARTRAELERKLVRTRVNATASEASLNSIYIMHKYLLLLVSTLDFYLVNLGGGKRGSHPKIAK